MTIFLDLSALADGNAEEQLKVLLHQNKKSGGGSSAIVTLFLQVLNLMENFGLGTDPKNDEDAESLDSCSGMSPAFGTSVC